MDASPTRAGDLVLDLGAGTGALTRPLSMIHARVLAVELNATRAARLRRRFHDDPVTVIHTDLRDLHLPRQTFRVVASPPYSLSTQALRLLLSSDRLLSADLVLQQAVARRLAASPPHARHTNRYLLSLGMQVPRRAFAPPPRVDSMVLRVRRVGQPDA